MFSACSELWTTLRTVPWWMTFGGGLAALGWAAGCLGCSGWLRTRKRWPVAYTRKLFHFGIFVSAGFLSWLAGLYWVCVFGCAVSGVLAVALRMGDGSSWYEALAREADTPYRTWHIVVPYLATLFGGLSIHLLAPEVALIGLWVAGVGDAAGEPVGAALGKHRYRVPGRRGLTTTRSIEGSLAVFLVSTCTTLTAVVALGLPLGWQVGLVGLTAALVEAVSPHGWDNLTMQIVPVLTWMVLS